ncbi:MAG: cytochrome c oxidase assembly protein [Chloroflexota bacterium]
MDAHLLSQWNFDPSIVAGIGVLAVVYVVWVRPVVPVTRWQIAAYFGGLFILFLALVSPLDLLSDRYLFSAHMLQHVLLLFVVPPMLIWGLPVSLLARVCEVVPEGSILRKIASPLPTFLLYVGLMWIWHLPKLYEAALGNELIHVGEHLCFLGSATLFWWLIVRSDQSLAPVPALGRIALLFGAAVGSSGLAALITFAGMVLYPTYALGPPYSAVRDALGMTPLVDQQVGGLLMWIGGGSWYLIAVAIIFFRWFDEPVPEGPSELDQIPARGNGVMT